MPTALAKIATNPMRSSANLLLAIFLLLVVPTTLVLFVRAEIRHPAVLARGLLLMSIILVLLFVNLSISRADTETAEEFPEESFVASI